MKQLLKMLDNFNQLGCCNHLKTSNLFGGRRKLYDDVRGLVFDKFRKINIWSKMKLRIQWKALKMNSNLKVFDRTNHHLKASRYNAASKIKSRLTTFPRCFQDSMFCNLSSWTEPSTFHNFLISISKLKLPWLNGQAIAWMIDNNITSCVYVETFN